jgi:hypothetical protein
VPRYARDHQERQANHNQQQINRLAGEELWPAGQMPEGVGKCWIAAIM